MSKLNRRSFIGQALAFSTVSGFASLLQAKELSKQLGKLQQSAVVLYRESNSHSKAFAMQVLQQRTGQRTEQRAEQRAEQGVKAIALHDDVVRQWRDGLEAELTVNNKLLLGMGNWADYTLLAGLAAEVRRFPLLTMQHSLKLQQADWVAQHAQEVLALTTLQDAKVLKQALATLARRSSLEPSAPSMFSWVLG